MCLSATVKRIEPCKGIFLPAPINPLYKAFSSVVSFPITSPVDFISGPREISTLVNFEKEKNPALGIRGYRLNSEYSEFLDSQLRAIFEAGRRVQASGKQIEISIMAPMVSTYVEARDFAQQARDIGFNSVGIMVEVPAIAMNIKPLAGLLDFVSVGTNDLSQYLFAADREGAGVAGFLDAWQPALLRLLANLSQDCAESKIKIGICGEAASDPLLAPFFAGIGINSLSCSTHSIDSVQDVLDRVDSRITSQVVEKVLLSLSPDQAREAVRDLFY